MPGYFFVSVFLLFLPNPLHSSKLISIRITNEETLGVTVSLTFNGTAQACEIGSIFIPPKNSTKVEVPSECLPLLEASGVMSGSTCTPFKPSPFLKPPSLVIVGKSGEGCEILPVERPLKEECCHRKLVGGKNYNLIGEASEKEMQDYGCKSPCVYSLEGNQGQKFCFRAGNMESTCTTSDFSVTNLVKDNKFTVIADYSNSSCDETVEITNSASFPNTKDCGPLVTVTAHSYLGTPHFSCQITSSYRFPNLYIKPITTGAGLEGCSIVDQKIKDLTVEPSVNPEFYVFVQSIDQMANVEVDWEEPQFCPTQSVFVFGPFVNEPIPGFGSYCGSYTIYADRFRPAPRARCQKTFTEYPIPDYIIVTPPGGGCDIIKYEV